jgi:LPPG:FO 2-phospho-L-lactate transferase
MITFLSGGTGTPKLLRGMRTVLPDRELCIVVNTAEDLFISGNHLSPDVDTVMYLFAGILDTETWWGISGDSHISHELANRFGAGEYITIGDQDRAVHIARGALLRGGKRLTECTRLLCERMGVLATVLPMTDDEVATYVSTPEGDIHFQEYWVKYRGKLPALDIYRRCKRHPVATDEVIRALEESDAVVIGPSNPVTSISPILECEGVHSALRDQFVIAVSPFIGDRPVSGPAAELMEAWGSRPDSLGTSLLYQDLLDVFIQDVRDTIPVEGAQRFDTLMVDIDKSIELSRFILELIRK